MPAMFSGFASVCIGLGWMFLLTVLFTWRDPCVAWVDLFLFVYGVYAVNKWAWEIMKVWGYVEECRPGLKIHNALCRPGLQMHTP